MTTPSMMQAVLPFATYPDVAFNFVVMLGLRPFGDFAEMSGLSYDIDPYTYNEMGRNESPYHFIYDKPAKRGEVTLKSGAVVTNSLYEWSYSIKSGGSFRRDVFILQLDRTGWPSRVMRLGRAWPKSWSGPVLDATKSEWALEDIVLVYESFELILPGSFQFYI
jgi:phage tail-like protein